jgi:hypothetical protein
LGTSFFLKQNIKTWPLQSTKIAKVAQKLQQPLYGGVDQKHNKTSTTLKETEKENIKQNERINSVI